MDKQEALSAFKVVAAIGETIRDLGEVPSGHLYAQLMSRMSLDTYNKIIGILKQTKLVKESGHLLTWIGPK
jgi:hypothetical protein